MAPKKWRLKAAETPACVPVVSFSHGTLNANTQLPVNIYEQKVTTAGRTKTRRILVSEADDLEYVGENYGEHGLRANSHCNHFVAVENVTTAPDTTKTYREKVDALATAFGSKRKRQAVETRLRLNVEESTLHETAASTLAAVKDTLATIQGDVKGAGGKTPTSIADAIPPQNRDATIPQDVYRIEDIIPAEQNECLDQLAEPLLNATLEDILQWRTDATYPEYVCNRVERLSRDPENRAIEARLLVFYAMLISLSRLKYTDMKKKDPLPDVPQPLKGVLLDTFTLTSRSERGVTSRNFPQRMKDKVLAYILVIVLVLEDYKFDFRTVQPDTKASDRTLTTLAYALGCHVGTHKTPGTRTGTKYLELKLPLVDPSQQLRAKRGRT
ncbi:hypothetical protein HPB48_015840 [Haemaphysalis longicornis]|uniref:DNA-directed RNA polymerase I subunit RPA49 n=1 Tax=Haemaphysalis longicornis TaxID=44386 RepID=A0A9J6FPV9_HAELO|nr:hypothetical protein HPB48_015840 [Haemaphysalis longicornis]